MRRDSGQSLVEFAVVLPVFLLVLVLTFDAGAMLWRFNMTASVATMVARDASINGPRAAESNGARLVTRLGYQGRVTAAYTPDRKDVVATATTTNRGVVFGRNLTISATRKAHVEVLR